MSKALQVRLTCGCTRHVSQATIAQRDAWYCDKHPHPGANGHSLAEVFTREWLVWCDHCPWNRWAGQNGNAARALKRNHSKYRLTHFVRMEYTEVPLMEYDGGTPSGPTEETP